MNSVVWKRFVFFSQFKWRAWNVSDLKLLTLEIGACSAGISSESGRDRVIPAGTLCNLSFYEEYLPKDEVIRFGNGVDIQSDVGNPWRKKLLTSGLEFQKQMGHFSSLFSGLARSLAIKKSRNRGNDAGREAVEAMAKEAKKNDLILRSPGILNADGSKNFVSAFSKRGKKGVNQDCFVVWEEFGCQEDMIFCGVFDGHGPWGHFVAKKVREWMPSYLLCNWQETLSLTSLCSDFYLESEKKFNRFDIWKQSYLKTCAAVDEELEQCPSINSFYSGTTALTIVRQGELIFIANVGDSRAVLATTSDDGSLVPVQLTVDFKPGLPHEAERIIQCKGQVFCLHDEPGVHRVWLPDGETPGLAMSRAFGDYCVKDFGLISVPEVTQRNITSRDHFVILATDGVWDVITNQEAVQIVSSAPDRENSAKLLVKFAVHAWKHKRKGIAMDDISAICLFLHDSPCYQQIEPISLPKEA